MQKKKRKNWKLSSGTPLSFGRSSGSLSEYKRCLDAAVWISERSFVCVCGLITVFSQTLAAFFPLSDLSHVFLSHSAELKLQLWLQTVMSNDKVLLFWDSFWMTAHTVHCPYTIHWMLTHLCIMENWFWICHKWKTYYTLLLHSSRQKQTCFSPRLVWPLSNCAFVTVRSAPKTLVSMPLLLFAINDSSKIVNRWTVNNSQ